jgi:hypothetical protein
VIVTQPSSDVAGTALNDIVVDLESAQGQLASADNSAVTLAIATGPDGASLGGVTTVQAVNGVATFTTLALHTAGHYTLVASDQDLAPANSKSFAISADIASAHLALIEAPTAAIVGKAVAPAVRVALEDPFGNIITGHSSKVTVTVASGPAGGALKGSASATISSAGIARFQNLLLTESGSYTLQFTDLKVSSVAAVTLAETLIPGATVISSPRAISMKVGKTIPITVHLTSSAAASILYSGDLNVEDQNGNFLGFATIQPNGTAKFFLRGVAAGDYLCQVNYSGDANHQGATSGTFALKVT